MVYTARTPAAEPEIDPFPAASKLWTSTTPPNTAISSARTVSYRVIDDPYVRIEGQQQHQAPDLSETRWIKLKTEELCFNDEAFCVTNPSFLADVPINSGDAMQGRTEVGMVFGPNGAWDVACFDNGCNRLKEAVTMDQATKHNAFTRRIAGCIGLLLTLQPAAGLAASPTRR